MTKRTNTLKILLLCALASLLLACEKESTPLSSLDDCWQLTAEQVTKKANAGDPFAQYTLADLHKSGGNGIALSEELETEWRQKAMENLKPLAELGNAEAQYLLGLSIFETRNPDDVRLKLAYLEQAAEQNHVDAQIQLIRIYTSNHFKIETDPHKVQQWQERAMPLLIQKAEQGDTQAQSSLFTSYADGSHGFPRDARKALYWREQTIEGLRQKVGSFASKHTILESHTLFMLNLLYAASGDKPADPIKAYTVTTLESVIFSESPTVRMWAEMRLESLLKKMSPQQREQAKALAEQCKQNITPVCY